MNITRDMLDALPSISLRGRVYVAKDALLAFIELSEAEKAESEAPAVPRRLKVIAHAIPEPDDAS